MREGLLLLFDMDLGSGLSRLQNNFEQVFFNKIFLVTTFQLSKFGGFWNSLFGLSLLVLALRNYVSTGVAQSTRRSVLVGLLLLTVVSF